MIHSTSSVRACTDRVSLQDVIDAWGVTLDGPEPPEPVLPVPAPAQGFSAWLIRQDGRDGPVGSLAFDVKHDRSWPGDVPVLAMFDHLTSEGAVPAALAALHNAWSEWADERNAR